MLCILVAPNAYGASCIKHILHGHMDLSSPTLIYIIYTPREVYTCSGGQLYGLLMFGSQYMEQSFQLHIWAVAVSMSTCKNTLTSWSCRYTRIKLLTSCKPHGFIAPVIGPLVNLTYKRISACLLSVYSLSYNTIKSVKISQLFYQPNRGNQTPILIRSLNHWYLNLYEGYQKHPKP